MTPSEDRAATRSVEETVEAELQRDSSWGLWAAVGFLTSGAFAAGFLVGVISDGNAEMMREFREKSPNRVIASTSDQANGEVPVAKPSPIPTTGNTDRRPNNQVDWAISMAPGTNVAPIDVRTADLDADTRMEFGTIYGNQVSPVATLWIRSASAAKIVLPLGNYSVRTTRIPLTSEGEEGNAEPLIVPGVMSVGRVEKGVSQALVAGNRTGIWRIVNPSASVAPRGSIRRKARTPRTKNFEYEGLGESSRADGSSTYEN